MTWFMINIHLYNWPNTQQSKYTGKMFLIGTIKHVSLMFSLMNVHNFQNEFEIVIWKWANKVHFLILKLITNAEAD